MVVCFSQHQLLNRLSFPVVYSYFLCHTNRPHMWWSISGVSILFLDLFLACSCAGTIHLFWSIQLRAVTWNQGAWCPQFCSFLRLLWLLGHLEFHMRSNTICSSSSSLVTSVLLRVIKNVFFCFIVFSRRAYVHFLICHFWVKQSF